MFSVKIQYKSYVRLIWATFGFLILLFTHGFYVLKFLTLEICHTFYILHLIILYSLELYIIDLPFHMKFLILAGCAINSIQRRCLIEVNNITKIFLFFFKKLGYDNSSDYNCRRMKTTMIVLYNKCRCWSTYTTILCRLVVVYA